MGNIYPFVFVNDSYFADDLSALLAGFVFSIFTDMKKLAALFFLAAFLQAAAQDNKKVDSLIKVTQSHVADTSRVRAFCLLCNQFYRSDSAKAKAFGEEGIRLAEKVDFKPGKAQCLAAIGYIYFTHSDYGTALSYYKKSYELRQQEGDSLRMTASIVSVGRCYFYMTKQDEALKCYFQARSYYEKHGRKADLMNILVDIGNVYYLDKNYESAFKQFEEQLNIAREMNDTSWMSTGYLNMGLLYAETKQYDKGLNYLQKGTKIDEHLRDTLSLKADYMNTGLLYYRMRDFDKAIDYYERCLAIVQKINDRSNESIVLNNIGEIYLTQKVYSLAIRYCGQSLAIAKEINQKDKIADATINLAKAYAGNGDFSKAYEYLTINSELKDSLFDEDRQQVMAEMQTKYDVDKKDKENELLNQKVELQGLEAKQQRTIIYSISAVAILILSLAFFVFRSYSQKKRANLKLEIQNSEIKKQKEIIEEKNKDITDSINYAKRIQDAMLPSMKKVKEYFPDSFILFKPKDIVSGDFYWFEKKNDSILFAAVDCTGHGVPGALMSVVGNNLLEQAVNEHGITRPAEILNEISAGLISRIGIMKEDKAVKDGMDIALCAFDTSKSLLQYSGAFNSIYHISNNELAEISADRQPVGMSMDNKPNTFSNHEVTLKKGDCIYLFSDGYADQFGGAERKKFKYSKFKKAILAVSNEPMNAQGEKLEAVFENWKGALQQIDDMLVIGIRIS